MTEERIITGIEVTTGEAADGVFLEELVEQSKKNGVNVEAVCGDMAYSGRDNLDYGKENKIKIVSKLNPVISNGKRSINKDFIYNKDADMFQCPAGNLAKRKEISCEKSSNKNNRIRYYFDTKKCKSCSLKEGCYKDGSNKKTYNVTILSEVHKEQKEFQETSYFKERSKERYKNGELKVFHGLGRADSVGLIAMRLQSYFVVFVVNVKRIVKMSVVKTV